METTGYNIGIIGFIFGLLHQIVTAKLAVP